MSLLLENIILNGETKDIYIDGERIKKIGKNLNLLADEKIDGKGEKAVLPGLINCHTHAAMTLFRGYGDDLPLKDWLEKKIWPLEEKLTEEDIYWGTKLACLEMIKTGTVCFNDMYWGVSAAANAAEEMGIRARIGLVLLDFKLEGKRNYIEEKWRDLTKDKFKTVGFSVAPHAIYTVCEKNLIWAKNFAIQNNLILHIHISETKEEVDNCCKDKGMRPVEYLDRIGFLGKNTLLAHGVWLSEKEMEILGERGCSVAYNPCSNLKLAVGGIFPYKELKDNGVNICFGTDSAASNNNLDLTEDIKVGSLLQKHRQNDPTAVSADNIFESATANGAKALKIESGEIEEGKLADLILIDLNSTFFCPGHNFLSDFIYSGSGSNISDVICNGVVIMRSREVEGERKILARARETAKRLIGN